MKTLTLCARQLSLTFLVVLFLVVSTSAQTTTITYQGKLPDEYSQPTALYDFQLNLYDEASGTNAPLNSTPILLEDVQVTAGNFTVPVNFGSLFNTGADRFMEIGVRPGNSTGDFTLFTSRAQILSTPHAIRSASAGTADAATNAQNLGGTSSSNFVQTNDPRLTDARTPTPGSDNYIHNTTTQQANSNFNVSGNGVVGGDLSVTGTLNASGSNLTNLNAANITTGTLDNARLGLISTANIANSSITTAKLADTSVGTSKLTDSAVTTSKIADSAVTTEKIADAAVSAAKIGSNQVVKNVNGLTDTVNLAAGANVTITPSGNTLTIAATGGGTFIHNTTTQQPSSNFNVSGTGTAANLVATSTISGNIVNATTQFNINGDRVLSVAGTDNIFAGKLAGLNNTTGYYNSFFGYQAGAGNTTGSSNSFVGYLAGNSTTTGWGNSFVGSYAGSLNTSGHYNSFFGLFAGYNNTTGHGNSFFGTNAGDSTTSGYSAVFVGSAAGSANTTGPNNSFVGVSAGVENTTGGSNAFFGTNAGDTNTTGNWNTIIGAHADVGSNNLSYGTAIGSGATVSTSNTIALGRTDGSDKVRIFGLGSAGSTQLCRNANNEVSTCSSSMRYKTNVAPFSFGMNLIQRLKPIQFEWKRGGTRDLGFGAEDVAAIEPLLATYNSNGEVEGVRYDRISAVLVNAIKEQQVQISNQQTQLQQQETELASQQLQLREQKALIEGLKSLVCKQNPSSEVCR